MSALRATPAACTTPPLTSWIASSPTVAYQIKSPWRPDQTHRVMELRELLARLAALVPPPRTPLIRFHGAIAPNFPHRNAVVALAPKAGIARDPQSCSATPGKRVAKAEHHDVQLPERCASASDEGAKSSVERGAAAVAVCSPPAPSGNAAVGTPASPAFRAGAECDALRAFESAISRIDIRGHESSGHAACR